MRNQQFEIFYPRIRTRVGLFDLSLVRATQIQWDDNNLLLAATKLIGKEAAVKQHVLYNFGTSNWRDGAAVLWISDSAHPNDGFLTGYIDQFDPKTGKSIGNDFTCVHDRLHDLHGLDFGRVDTFCLLGTHLVHRNPHKPIIIVRHPITALVASFHIPAFTWLAVGAYEFIDLNCPTYIVELPSSQPVVLLAEPEDLDKWTNNAANLATWLECRNRKIFCLSAKSLPEYDSNTTSAIHNNHSQTQTIIENLWKTN